MKMRRIIFLASIAITCLVAWMLFFSKKPAHIDQPQTSEIERSKGKTEIVPLTTSNDLKNTNAQNEQFTNTNTPPSSPQTKAEQIKEGLAKLNDVEIVFYGKLEDQFGDPVVDASITGNTIVRNGVTQRSGRFSTTSDRNGLFQINAGKGESLGVMPKKEGYVIATTRTEFKYSYMYQDRFTPDARNPAVIKMWKLQGREPLLNIDQSYKIQFSNAPIYFDLIARKIVPSRGDIKITVSRAPGVVSSQTLQDWSVQVEAIDGGLIRTHVAETRVTFSAPEDGYQPIDKFTMSTNAPNKWFGGFHQMYFVKSRNEQVFAKIDFGIAINRNPADKILVEFSGVANTNGSRNWEETAPK